MPRAVLAVGEVRADESVTETPAQYSSALIKVTASSSACALQAHLCGYEARAVPVVRTGLADFGDTLDRLHDYLLTCIQVALEQSG